MDGASYWRRFFRIVLPWISPVVFFAIVYASIGALQVFESIVILTRGGPGDATRSMSILIVEEAFDSFEIGYAAAIAVVMTVGDPRHHRRSSSWPRAPGFDNDDAVQSLAAGDRLGDHRRNGAARRLHAAAFRLALQHVVSHRARRLSDAAEFPAAAARSRQLPRGSRLLDSLPADLRQQRRSCRPRDGRAARHLHARRLRFRAAQVSRTRQSFLRDADRAPVSGASHDHSDLSRLCAGSASSTSRSALRSCT